MIPLRLKAECDTDLAPFVVRVSARQVLEGSKKDTDAFVIEAKGTVVSFGSVHHTFRLRDVLPSAIEGDVLLIDPRRQIAHRLIRAGSPHNTFLVTEQCDQLCVMCSQPPKARHVDLYPYFREAALLAPKGAVIGISGGEPILHKEALFSFLTSVLVERDDLRFHILSNGQHFSDDDLPMLRRFAGNVLWGIPIYSADPQLHDEIVGKEEAFQALKSGLSLLGRSGAAIELRTVVMLQNSEGLPHLADFISRHLSFASVWALMQLERIGFGRMNWHKCFFDNGADFAGIGAAIDIMTARHNDVVLYNFPLCTVPEAYRPHCMASISDWKRKYLECCSTCSVKEICGGFFEWYDVESGYLEITPQ